MFDLTGNLLSGWGDELDGPIGWGLQGVGAGVSFTGDLVGGALEVAGYAVDGASDGVGDVIDGVGNAARDAWDGVSSWF